MDEELVEKRIRIVRRKLKRKNCWGFGYMEDMARNEAQQRINRLTNDKRGDEALVRYLAKSGYSAKQIIRETLRIRKLIVGSVKERHRRGE